MKLYSYWRSTTSYRVRAALNLKGIHYETVSVDLVAGEQKAAGYLALNPVAGVPTLELDDRTVLIQSMAILDYVDANWPEPRLIPKDPLERARVKALAYTVAMDIHPVNNLRVIGQLVSRFGASAGQCQDWVTHWMTEGLTATEALLSDKSDFSFGVAPNIADLCIAAQVYNAHRWGVDMVAFPKITRIEQNCLALPEIAAAHPDQQPDAKGDL
jgi:maleylacetoacetate isomerase/maleylpyruvate isomerase